MQAIQKARSLIGRRLKPFHEVTVQTAADLIELAHWTERPALRLLVPIHLLRMQGAFTYGPEHPFVAALNNGVESLESFYTAVRPKMITEFYGIADGTRLGSSLPPWELPWYGRALRTPPPGEHGLSPEHGVSFYGPASAQKMALEMKRLESTRADITALGYDPDAYGNIEGYVLRHNDEACFFVRGGKHRTAALTAMGWTHIPVAFRSTFPRIVDTSQAEYWPLVRSGKIDINLAREILVLYTRGR
jgi:hypothetical protein